VAVWFAAAGVLTGLISAGLWLCAAFGVKFDVRTLEDFSGLTDDTVRKLQAQITMNGFAAVAAAVSALLQAIALFLAAK
jgi:hypothetical protein